MRFRQLKQYILICLCFGLFVLLLKSRSDSNDSKVHSTSDSANEIDNPNPFPHEKIPDSELAKPSDIQKDEDLVDYHDYKQMEIDSKMSGPGEQGFGILIQEAGKDKHVQEVFRVNGFNGVVSDKISLERSLRDIRHPECLKKKYSKDLPTVSLVIPFYEEHLSTLLRTFISCVKRSPKGVIKEVILVDDASKKHFLKQELENYVGSHYPDLVKIIRSPKREGLIRTRLLGAKDATGDVLIFLDSHCECSYNWLPPLLEPIKKNPKTATCPFIDVIKYNTFEYEEQDSGARGAFNWEFYYKRLPRLPEDRKTPAEPFDSPVMAGGLFAINRAWFWELGGYDPLLKVWGGEQYELSFKLWMCGGRMVDVPCSRVGHVYRKFNPFGGSSEEGDYIGRNYKRVAEVWMDEYKEYIYQRKPNYYKNIDTFDLTEQKELRRKLQCKSFKWFIDNVAFDLPKRYPPVEPDFVSDGEIRNSFSNLCINVGHSRHNLELTDCIKDGKLKSGQQHFQFTWREQIQVKDTEECLDLNSQTSSIVLMNCRENNVNQKWRYNPNTRQIYNKFHNLCLEADIQQKSLKMASCDGGNSQAMKWDLEKLNRSFAFDIDRIHG